jgi:hypothetical protein
LIVVRNPHTAAFGTIPLPDGSGTPPPGCQTYSAPANKCLHSAPKADAEARNVGGVANSNLLRQTVLHGNEARGGIKLTIDIVEK